jgi:N-ethylmaleimide reductase
MGRPSCCCSRIGWLSFQLANRVVMAPLTRCRATNPDLLPTDLHVRYYTQHASAGLIITEGTRISRDAVGWHDVPGLFTDAQMRAWSAVTDAVHRAGGIIFVQLWHTGSSSHADFFDGTPPLAPSAVNPAVSSPTSSGNQPTVTPRAMTLSNIRTTIDDYATAAANAMRAGFDGVQVQAGFNYLISQFLNPRTNVRSDAHGGSMENRARLLFDVLDAIGERIGIGRVGVKAGPAWGERGEFVSTADTLATSEYVVDRLNDYPLAHWLLMGAMADLSGRPLAGLQGDGMFSHFRPCYRGTLISNVGMTRERGNHLIADGLADLVAFGETFIANADLPARFAALAPIQRSDRALHYTPGPHGYIDYPPYQPTNSVRPASQLGNSCVQHPASGAPVDEFASAEPALAAAHHATETIGDDDLDRPTPCPDWDVQALADHLIDTLSRLGAAAGVEPPIPDGKSIDQHIRRVTEPILTGWRRRGLAHDVEFAGRTLPLHLARGILQLELVVHGWDFAVALRRPLDVADAHAAHVLGLSRQTLNEQSRISAGFDPPVPVPVDAGPLDQLVAFTGRNPSRQNLQ